MEISYPAYYEAFQCLAGGCPDSCCKDWAVEVDEASARRYRSLPGALGDALRTNLVQEEGVAVLALVADGRCPMWRQDGLCQLQAQLGPEGLCAVCRDFPRLRHDYGDFVELGLELSCPEAARLILNDDGCERIVRTLPGGEEPDYDPADMACLKRGRREALGLLRDRRFSVGEVLALLLLHSYEVQAELDGGERGAFDPAKALKTARKLGVSGDFLEILQLFRDLEILTPAWRSRLENPGTPGPWRSALRAMARYGVERYYFQSVADGDLVGRMKLVILGCLVVKNLGGDPV